MPLPSRLLLSAFLLALPSGAASAAAVPPGLVGEWLQGAQYPASVYTADHAGASANASRLLLNGDGSYVFTRFESTFYPSSFGTTGYPITCQFMDAVVESGTFSVQGSRITLKPSGKRQLLAYTPDRLNNGCKRSSGTKKTGAGSGPDTGTWQLGPGKLTLKFGNSSQAYVRRTPAAKPPPSTGLSAELRGEWHSGTVSPTEYYNVATGKWAEASGTSVILRLGADLTYERTGLLVVTTYGCTSKLLVQEKGRVAQNGPALTFTPTTSSSTGYTCSPSKTSSAKNNVKPYSMRALVRVEASGQHVLSLTSDGGETLFNRPPDTRPESAPGTNRGAVTPPPPGQGGGGNTPPKAAPSKWTARGEWDAEIRTVSGTVRVRFSMDDDEPRILGSGFSGDEVVGWIQGSSATGALRIGLEVEGDREVELNVTGTFSGDTYRGSFTTKNASGEALAGGTITMTRR